MKERRPDNVERFVRKFEKDMRYGNEYLSEFEKIFMLWSPIVRTSREGSRHNQMNDIQQIKNILKEKFEVNLRVIINEEFMKCIDSLRKVALNRTDEIKSPILRYLQIEEKLKAHISRMDKGKISSLKTSATPL